MNLADEDWLSDEKFDFDLNLSKSSVENILDGNDDNELFVDGLEKGTQSNGSITEGWLLKESALLALKIKSRGTPGHINTASNTKSPVAVVHPMRRDDIDVSICHENKENIPKNQNSNDASIGMTNLSLSAKLDMIQKGIHSNINTPASNKTPGRLSLPHKPSGNPIGLVEPFSADQKLEEKRKEKLEPPKINSNSLKIKQTNLRKPATKIASQNAKTAGFAEPLVNKSQSMSEAGTKVENAGLQSRLKKPLMIPKPGGISKSKSGGGIPSNLPSSLPNKNTKQDAGTSGMKPLKVQSQSLSGISQPREKLTKGSQLKLSGRKCVSAGTPENSGKIGLNSAKKQSSCKKKLTASSSIGTPLNQKRMLKPPKSATKQNSLITPVVKPARKSIVSRKLNPANDESTKSVLDADIEQSSLNVDVPFKVQDPSNDNVFEENGNYFIEPVEAVDNSSCSTTEAAVKDSDITCDPKCVESSKSSESECLPQEAVLDKTVVSDSCAVETSEVDYTETPVINDMTVDCIDKTETELLERIHISSAAVASPAPLLIDICSLDPALSPVMVNAMDPFKTGNTPPPLIQLDMILEPERPPELNLIEF